MAVFEKTLFQVNCRRCLGRGRIQTEAGAFVPCRWCGGTGVNHTDQYHLALYLHGHPWRDRITDFHTHKAWRKIVLVVPAVDRHKPSFAEWVWLSSPEGRDARQIQRSILGGLRTMFCIEDEIRFFEAALTPPTLPSFAVNDQRIPVRIRTSPAAPIGQIISLTPGSTRPVTRIINIGQAAQQEIENRLPTLETPPWERNADDEGED